ncbi:MAG: TIGR04348 family glycosyltransferase, partial [Planctomycetota bacterium]|nr:TIGR04348 family glycosyltransferase [Planctomycetota bacterium]
MRVLIITPVVGRVWTGNRRTTDTWTTYLSELGHDVRSADASGDAAAEVLIALNASKTNAAVGRFRRAHPNGKVVVALSGTDIYAEPDAA